MDRVDAGLKACIKLGIVYAILAFVFILLFGKNLALLFLDAEETEIIKLVYYFLLGNSGAYILLALVNIVRFMIQDSAIPPLPLSQVSVKWLPVRSQALSWYQNSVMSL